MPNKPIWGCCKVKDEIVRAQYYFITMLAKLLMYGNVKVLKHESITYDIHLSLISLSVDKIRSFPKLSSIWSTLIPISTVRNKLIIE